MVKEVVREPAALLPEETNQGRGDQSGGGGPRELGQDADGGGQDRAVKEHLEGIVELAALKQAHVLEGGPELAGVADKLCSQNKNKQKQTTVDLASRRRDGNKENGGLTCLFLLAVLQLADLELGEHGVCGGRVESRKDI